MKQVRKCRKMRTGIKSGYKESVIVEAVIRAVSPNLKLCSYLEMINDMSLVCLKQMLQAHFKETSGTEMYQELSCASTVSSDATAT